MRLDGLIREILIATDGSETALEAARIGVDIASRSRASVTAVYVVDVFRLARLPGYAALPGLKEKLLELMRREGERATDEVGSMAIEAGVSFRGILAEGDPGEELLRIARQSGADLLIAGSVGRSAIDRFLLGSIAEKVVRQSGVPVLLVPKKSSGRGAQVDEDAL
ncbi:MAG: universal stress protein [Methanothrix sp.]|nr:universal stress protein [Methanothrix sp.]